MLSSPRRWTCWVLRLPSGSLLSHLTKVDVQAQSSVYTSESVPSHFVPIRPRWILVCGGEECPSRSHIGEIERGQVEGRRKIYSFTLFGPWAPVWKAWGFVRRVPSLLDYNGDGHYPVRCGERRGSSWNLDGLIYLLEP